MASILSHPAIPLGITAAFGTRIIPPRLAVLGAICSVLPDLDSIGFRVGIPYGHPLGHRGFSHSIVFALLVAVASALSHRRLHTSARIAFLFAFASTASHGVLDALTTGGLGVAFFSPVSNQRYFLPWRVIEVSPISVTAFLSTWGRRVLFSELKWVWAPSSALGLMGIALRSMRGSA